MVVGIKTSLNIKLQHSVGLQTLTMLMNAACSLIMSHGEVVFLGYFPDEVLLEVGKCVEVCGVRLLDCEGGWVLKKT